MEYTFEQLPQAISQLSAKVDRLIELFENSPTSEVQADQVLTIKEAAKLLTLSVPTLYGLVSNSKIPYSKPGKRLYFSRLELLGWLKESRRKTSTEIDEEVGNYLKSRKK
jgi:excisionase family DNA binding protein